MKTYEIKFELRVSDKENIDNGFYEHEITFITTKKNKLDAINTGIQCLNCMIKGSWEEEKISEKIGREFRIRSYELTKISSVKVVKEEE